MNQILFNTTRTTDKTKLWIILLIVLIIAIICLSTVFALTNIGNENIINNVYASGIDISKKSKEEAKALIEEHLDAYKNKEITLAMGNKSYKVSADALGFDLSNIDEVIEEAYNYGRSGNFLANNYTILLSNFTNKNINLVYVIENEPFNDVIADITTENEATVVNDNYEVSGDTLIIKKGQDGLTIDTDTLLENLVENIINVSGESQNIEVPIIEAKAEKLDFDNVYKEVCTEVENASFTSGENFTIIPEKYGVTFDLGKAKEMYDSLENSGEMTVDLVKIEPTVKVEDLDAQLYKDVLGTFSTKYSASEKNKTKNMQTASNKINGVVLYPGSEISFNKIAEERTTANGYASASSYDTGKYASTVGGGVSQVSSTLYNAVLRANLNVTEREKHEIYIAFVEPSLDAAVNNDKLDFKFVNNRNYPIKIVSEMKNGVITINILGIKEENEPIIEIESKITTTNEYEVIKENDSNLEIGTIRVTQSGVNGYVSEAYKIVKNASGDEVSRNLISKDEYATINQIEKVGTKEVTPPPAVVEPEHIPTPPREPDKDLPAGWDSPYSPYSR